MRTVFLLFALCLSALAQSPPVVQPARKALCSACVVIGEPYQFRGYVEINGQALPSGQLAVGDAAGWNVPSSLNVPGYAKPWAVFATNDNSQATVILASGNAGAATGKTPQLIFLQSNGSLQNPNENVAGGAGAINSVAWVGGSVQNWRTFTVMEFGNRGANPTQESHVRGKFQLGVAAGSISNRPGLVLLDDTALLTNNLPLRLYRVGMQNTFNGEDAYNHERVDARWAGESFRFGPVAAGTGTLRPMVLTGASVTVENALRLTPITFASLGVPVDGTLRLCSDCASVSGECAAGGNGGLAVGISNAWKCIN